MELQKEQRSQEVIFNLKSRVQELEQQLLNSSTNKVDIEALKKKHEKEIDDLSTTFTNVQVHLERKINYSAILLC